MEKLFFVSIFSLITIVTTAQSYNFDTDKSVLYNLENNPEFSTLVEALNITGLINSLQPVNTPQMGYTIFCPTNDAFLNSGINIENFTVDELSEILLYHLSFGGPYALNLSCPYPQAELPMANGELTDPNDYSTWTSFLTIENDCQNITLDNNAQVLESDIRVYGYEYNGVNGYPYNTQLPYGYQIAEDNGMIQVINAVLIPEQSPLSAASLETNESKQLIRIVNLLGQEVEFELNKVLIYMYSDGSSERKFVIE